MTSCFDWSIDRACEPGNPYSLPDGMRHHLIIQRFSHRINSIMSGNASDPLGLPSDSERYMMMNLLNKELDMMEAKFQHQLSSKSAH